MTGTQVRLLRPLARVLLRHGFSSYDFNRLANIAFIQAAEDILQSQGKTPNFSRVSAITGMHRHVVSSFSRVEEPDSDDWQGEKEYQRNRLSRVLTGWYENPEYTDSEGRPLILTLEGPPPSFDSLVRSFSGDIYPKVILDELTRVGAARIQRDGTIKVLSRRFTQGGADPAAIQNLGAAASDLMATLERNLDATDSERVYQDQATTFRLDRSAVPLLRQMLNRRGADFLEDAEGWLLEHEAPDDGDAVRAGVAVYMFVEDPATKD